MFHRLCIICCQKSKLKSYVVFIVSIYIYDDDCKTSGLERFNHWVIQDLSMSCRVTKKYLNRLSAVQRPTSSSLNSVTEVEIFDSQIHCSYSFIFIFENGFDIKSFIPNILFTSSDINYEKYYQKMWNTLKLTKLRLEHVQSSEIDSHRCVKCKYKIFEI